MRINRKRAEEIVKAGAPQSSGVLSALNSTGDVDTSTAGYDFALRTTSYLTAKVVLQKFYEVGPGNFIPIVEGEGAFFEDVRINRQFITGGKFEQSRISTMTGNAKIGNVKVGNIPKTIVLSTFAEGINWNELELQKALTTTNWDFVSGMNTALKKYFDLGVQKLAFLGLLDDQTNTPGLYSMADVTINTTRITAKLSSLSTDDFQTFVANIVADYRSNCSQTAWPDTFVMPEADWLGMGRATSTTAQIISRIKYLESVFQEVCMNPKFQVLPCAYGNKAKNSGYTAAGGKSRYILYRQDPDTLRMEMPVPYTVTPAARVGALNMETAAYLQASGCIPLRPAEIVYFDDPNGGS